jgi:hypothetical protein
LKNELSSLAWQKIPDDRDFKGYPSHINTFKVFGRHMGLSENLQFFMISVLRAVIFLKASPLSIAFSIEGEFRYINSIFLVPF